MSSITDIRNKEFIGVVLPDPRKESSGMFGGMMGGLIGIAANYMTGGMAGVAMGAISGGANIGGLGGVIGNVGFNNVLSHTNLIPNSISMGFSSLNGGSFLNLGSALTGFNSNTPNLIGLTDSFNAISGLTSGFGGLNSVGIGLDNSVLNNIGSLGSFASLINSSIPLGVTETLFNSVGLNLQDLGISQEILTQLGLSDSNPINLNDVFSFNGVENPYSGGSDIRAVQSLGNQVATEADGNVKVLVHVPELMYHIEEEKGIWCFNRLVTTVSETSGNNSGMLGSMSNNMSGFGGGSVMSGGDFGASIGGMAMSGVGNYFNGPTGSNIGSTTGTAIGTVVGGPIGGAIGGAIGSLFGGDSGSGSSGAYGPLQPGSKVFIRFTENDFNTGNIVGVVHDEEETRGGGGGGFLGGIGGGTLGGGLFSNVGGGLLSGAGLGGDLTGMGNIAGFTGNVMNFDSTFSNVSDKFGSVSDVVSVSNSFANSQLSSTNTLDFLSSDTFSPSDFVSKINTNIGDLEYLIGNISV